MPTPRLVIPLVIAAALLAKAPPAHAGTFTVHTCQTPTGTWIGNEGWTSASSTPVQGEEPANASACTEADRGLRLGFGLGLWPVSPNRSASWTFVAPTGTQITAITLRRTLQLGWPVVANRYDRPYLYDAWHDQDTSGNQLESDTAPFNGEAAGVDFPDSLVRTGVSWNSISLRLSCWGAVGSLDCGPYPAQVAISRAAIGLVDGVVPAGAATGGALTGDDPVRGVAGLALHASDEGGGVYRVALAVDGDEVLREVLDGAGGSCADVEPSNEDPHEFASPRPCPLSMDGSVELDTATLRDGEHTVRVTVEDAGGNEAIAYEGTITTHNAPINTGAPVLAGQASVGSALTAAPGQWDGAPSGFGHRWLRCDAAGAACEPIAGASGAGRVLDEADAYHRLRVEVTAENGSGTAVARSAPSALVADAAGRTTSPAGTAGSGGGSGATAGQGLVNPLAQLPGHVANGSDASGHAHITVAFQRADGGRAHRIRVRKGRRMTIVGRLTDASGRGIGGAQLGVAWRIAGRRWVARPAVRTGADGRFVYLLAAGPSRDVRFAYFAYSDSRSAELSNVVHADVLVPLTIRADRRRVSGERLVRLSGRVAGGSIPRAGLLVTLQGYQRGWGWRVFRTVRTDGRGRWSSRYRFRLSEGRFGFRALVPHQGRFPFATSRSRGVFVVVS